MRGEVLRERRIDELDELRHALDAALDARLRGDVVILDAVEQTRETPERIGLDCGEDSGREDGGIDFFGIGICGFHLIIKTDLPCGLEEATLPRYADRNTSKNGVARSFIPPTFPQAGCRIAQTYSMRSRH